MSIFWLIIGAPAALAVVLFGILFVMSLCAVAKKPLPPYSE